MWRLSNSRRLSLEHLESRLCLATSVTNVVNLNATNAWETLREITPAGNNTFFVGRSSASADAELWRVYGEQQFATKLVNLGVDDSESRQLTNVAGTLYFRGFDTLSGFELWKSDGTMAGTSLVRDLTRGAASSTIQQITAYKNFVWFVGNGDLYRCTPETSAVAKMIDVKVDGSDSVEDLTVSGNWLYFTAQDAAGQRNLYRSNGTLAGTRVISNSPSGGIGDLVDVNGVLYFSQGDRELWSMNHQTGLASRVAVISTHRGAGLREFTNGGGTLYFATHFATYKSDGTAAGTVSLGGTGNARELFYHSGKLFFQDGYALFNDGDGAELWSINGSGAAFQVKDIDPSFNEGYSAGSYPHDFHSVNGQLFFRAAGGLWTSDGTEAGTVQVEDGPLSDVATSATRLFFSRKMPDTNQWTLYARRGGSTESTPVLRSGPGNGDGVRQAPVRFGNSLFVAGTNGRSGSELWRLAEGRAPQLVIDLTPGPNGSGISNLTAINGALYFTATSPTQGTGLWKSNGTASGTIFLKEVSLNKNARETPFVKVGNDIYFSGFTRSSGYELWKSDGTVAGTLMVKDIFPGTTYDPYTLQRVVSSSDPKQLVAFNNQLYFTAANRDGNTELWRSDGSAQGTVMAFDLYPPNSYGDFDYGSFPDGLTVRSNKLYFAATDRNGRGMWQLSTSGSPEKFTGPEVSVRSGPTFVNNTLYFSGTTNSQNIELWKSAGTPATTSLVKDIVPGSKGSSPSHLTAIGERLFFVADDGTNGSELWQSDGTAAGTTMVANLNSSGSSNPLSLTVLGQTLFFSAQTPERGRELYRTSGNLATAQLVRDLNPGMHSSNPSALTVIGNDLYFTAQTSMGHELWRAGSDLRLSITPATIAYQSGQASKKVAPNATLSDADTINFRAAVLDVRLGAGYRPGIDRLQLIGGSEITVSGPVVRSYGVSIGTLVVNGASLRVTFNANATLSSIRSTIRSLGFSSSLAGSVGNRDLSIRLTDGEGGIANSLVRIAVT